MLPILVEQLAGISASSCLSLCGICHHQQRPEIDVPHSVSVPCYLAGHRDPLSIWRLVVSAGTSITNPSYNQIALTVNSDTVSLFELLSFLPPVNTSILLVITYKTVNIAVIWDAYHQADATQ
jgi:hypothetical protein